MKFRFLTLILASLFLGASVFVSQATGVAASAIPDILPPIETASPGVLASPASASVTINDRPVVFSAYNINGANYFRLRDVAFALNGTDSQFNVSWSEAANAVTLLPGQAYDARCEGWK